MGLTYPVLTAVIAVDEQNGKPVGYVVFNL
jgi:hypothetical protein